jgi:hypothetical protein
MPILKKCVERCEDRLLSYVYCEVCLIMDSPHHSPGGRNSRQSSIDHLAPLLHKVFLKSLRYRSQTICGVPELRPLYVVEAFP